MRPRPCQHHVFDVESIDWKIGPVLTQSARLDPVLSISPGLLYWWWQVELLLSEVYDISRTEARKLWMSYLRQETGTVQRFQNTGFEERSFLATNQERTAHGQYFRGWPDWHLAGFLSEHVATCVHSSGTR